VKADLGPDPDERARDERARKRMPEPTHNEHATHTTDLDWTVWGRHGLLHSSEYSVKTE
jgi:hypothetical protein